MTPAVRLTGDLAVGYPATPAYARTDLALGYNSRIRQTTDKKEQLDSSRSYLQILQAEQTHGTEEAEVRSRQAEYREVEISRIEARIAGLEQLLGEH